MTPEQQSPQEDEYAQGMTSWQPDDEKSIEQYTAWQTDERWPYLGDRVLEIGAGAGRISSNLCQEA